MKCCSPLIFLHWNRSVFLLPCKLCTISSDHAFSKPGFPFVLIRRGEAEGLWPLDTLPYLFLSPTVCCDREEGCYRGLPANRPWPPPDFPSVAHVVMMMMTMPGLESLKPKPHPAPGTEDTLEEGKDGHLHTAQYHF